MRRWVTCGSTTFEAMVNPHAAACATGFVPDESVILSNAEIKETVDRAATLAEAIVNEYDSSLATSIESLDAERDFEGIVSYFRDNVQTTEETEVAVDVTPGRKFMSAIAFQAGFVVALTGDVLTMPGLPADPAAAHIDVDDDGDVHGLF